MTRRPSPGALHDSYLQASGLSGKTSFTATQRPTSMSKTVPRFEPRLRSRRVKSRICQRR
jgi:hypothetical protein